MSEIWEDIKRTAVSVYASRRLPAIYFERLRFEIKEIEKQGAEAYWVKLRNANNKFSSNPNSLVLPWLLGMVEEDPIATRTTPLICTSRYSDIIAYKNTHGAIPYDIVRDPDMPDIDVDCLPYARDKLKEYAISRYGVDTSDGYGSVCSVGTWQTYKFKLAVVDAAVALGVLNRYEAEAYTKNLPDDVDDLLEDGKAKCKAMVRTPDGEKECGCLYDDITCPKCGSQESDSPTIGQLIHEHQDLQRLQNEYPDIVYYATRLIGKTRNMGMHAGALIITDRSLFGNVPLYKNSRKGFWTSMWTEGRNSQLSKFGYIKWDFLGLKTLQYIYDCCNLIFENRGISFGTNLEGFDDSDIREDRLGYLIDPQGNKHLLTYSDRHAITLADKLLVSGIFQFDTDTAKGILANRVRSFNDLLLYNAMGHPGPMQCCWSESPISIIGGTKPIKDLDPKYDIIMALGNDRKMVLTKNYKVVDSGKKKLYKITTKDGRILKVSADHKLLTTAGYVAASDLTTAHSLVSL